MLYIIYLNNFVFGQNLLHLVWRGLYMPDKPDLTIYMRVGEKGNSGVVKSFERIRFPYLTDAVQLTT